MGRKQPKDEYTSALPSQDDCCFREETAKFVEHFNWSGNLVPAMNLQL